MAVLRGAGRGPRASAPSRSSQDSDVEANRSLTLAARLVVAAGALVVAAGALVVAAGALVVAAGALVVAAGASFVAAGTQGARWTRIHPPMSALLTPSEPGSALATPAPRGAPVAMRGVSASKWRFVRAYSTTFIVIGSYIFLSLRARVLGSAWREANVGDVHTRNARRVYATILKLQGLFIKVGQLLSIMANFLPPEFRSELEGLQDQVPPRPFSEIESRIKKELGDSMKLIAALDREPTASASLGQVHAARLTDGRRVAVKVQHRDIDRIVRLDLKTIRRILGIVQFFVPVQGLDAYYHQIKELLSQELDFALEADNIESIAKNFAKDPRVVFPRARPRAVHPARAHHRVRRGREGERRRGAADPRRRSQGRRDAPGAAVLPDDLRRRRLPRRSAPRERAGPEGRRDRPARLRRGRGALPAACASGIPEFLEGVLRRDTDRLFKSMRKMGFITRASDEAVSEKIIEYFHRRFQEEVRLETFNLKDITIDPQRGFENLLDLRQMNVGLREMSGSFHIPKDWVLLERTHPACSTAAARCSIRT